MVSNSLEKIINKKKDKLNSLKNKLKIEELRYKIENFNRYFNFKEKIYFNLLKGKYSLIAEIKKASPSAGVIIENYNPVDIAAIYQKKKCYLLICFNRGRFFSRKLRSYF